jgi:hypothetical protein
MTKEFDLSRTIIGDEIQVKYVKEFILWCEKHSHISEGVNVISIDKLKQGAGSKLTGEGEKLR